MLWKSPFSWCDHQLSGFEGSISAIVLQETHHAQTFRCRGNIHKVTLLSVILWSAKADSHFTLIRWSFLMGSSTFLPQTLALSRIAHFGLAQTNQLFPIHHPFSFTTSQFLLARLANKNWPIFFNLVGFHRQVGHSIGTLPKEHGWVPICEFLFRKQ